MNNIQNISDLHLDFEDNWNFCKNNLNSFSEILLVAGDSCQLNYCKKARFFEKYIYPKWKIVIEVPGNHDFYGKTSDYPFLYSDKITRFFDNKEGDYVTESNDNTCTHHYINNGFIDINNIRVICSTLWSKVEKYQKEVNWGLNDYVQIKGYNIELNNRLNHFNVNYIDKVLDETPQNKQVIILTHHAPLWCMIDDKFKHSTINEAFANNLDDLIKKHSTKINTWVYGHMHKYDQRKVYGVNFVRNPVGYVCMKENKSVDLMCQIPIIKSDN
jgi:Icc-related predicted phosphoesterase